ncbi:M61 family metallopeptidase [Echinicola sp. 20G]|uniref:M61 family metallopeptidase n=1 Tax=Echinicola sp. 20G TaxID=2781961 RepID=UPI0019108A32|nr:M61 family metallopeptidase [Echinicola sp. 20G]
MEYLIYRNNPADQFIQIQLTLKCNAAETVRLQLPSWRPGRYEITNYAQKIRRFSILSNDQKIDWKKITKDLWTFSAPKAGKYTVKYEYHASQMDAGGSWSDDEQLYLNFINFCFELKGREDESVSIELKLPAEYRTATALPKINKNTFAAENFQHLVDSPLIASSNIQHYSYQLEDINFHLWFQGEIHFDVPELINKFKAFTQKQLDAYGDFPARDYHFLYQLLPYKHYHGVEHQFSTVITFGPANTLAQKENMDEFMGVSSHELYHFWNVCRIRPKELLPYDFSQEAYIDTGVVAEGVTTYMGDLFLLKSGYFSLEDFLTNMEKQLEREFHSLGWTNQSIKESSFDLWLDGYKQGIPEKKVSIYNRGALISMCLDLQLIDKGISLHQVMKEMWKKFGKTSTGYTLEDYKNTIILLYEDEEKVNTFFKQYILGTEDILPLLIDQLESLNISLETVNNANLLTSNWGVKTQEDGTIIKVHPHSAAFQQLMIGDIILEINEQPFDLESITKGENLMFKINRFGRILTFQIETSGGNYYPEYKLIPRESNRKRTIWMS